VILFLQEENIDMNKDFKEYIKELDNFKKIHHFKYSEIADMLDTTTRSLRRWIREGVCPLPIYKKRIIQLLGSKNIKK